MNNIVVISLTRSREAKSVVYLIFIATKLPIFPGPIVSSIVWVKQFTNYPPDQRLNSIFSHMQITSIVFHASYFGEEEEASAAFCFPKRGKIAL
jgi:hypothetical protein